LAETLLVVFGKAAQLKMGWKAGERLTVFVLVNRVGLPNIFASPEKSALDF
jgi:hypothetical protein